MLSLIRFGKIELWQTFYYKTNFWGLGLALRVLNPLSFLLFYSNDLKITFISNKTN